MHEGEIDSDAYFQSNIISLCRNVALIQPIYVPA